jgi:hypothetical protein
MWICLNLWGEESWLCECVMYFAAVCEKCGAIGVKHAFYTKERRFCSLACAREYSELERTGQTIRKPFPLLNVSYLVDICMDLIHSFLLQDVQRPHSYSYSVFLFYVSQFISSMRAQVCYKMIDFTDCSMSMLLLFQIVETALPALSVSSGKLKHSAQSADLAQNLSLRHIIARMRQC